MKKIFLTTLAALVVPTLVLAQGTMNFSSTAQNHYLVLSDDTRPAGMVAALLWSPDNVVAYTEIATSTTLGPANGYLTTPTTGTTGGATAPGASAWFKVSGTYQTYGPAETPAWNQATGGGGTPAAPPANMTGWTAPLVIPIPEPSIIALAGLGVASLLIFRRRK